MDLGNKIFSASQKGFVLITSLFVMSLLLLAGLYISGAMISNHQMSTSYAASLQAHYLAESGLAEGIWRINNDPDWSVNFETDPAWQKSLNKNSNLYPGSSYTIEVLNSDLAKGKIKVTALVKNGSNYAKRVISASIYKPISNDPAQEKTAFAGGNLTFDGSKINIVGDIYSDNNIMLSKDTKVNVSGTLAARTNVLFDKGAVLTSDGYTEHSPGLATPAISFDSAGDPNSYKSRADHIYTSEQFENLLWQNQNLSLAGIIYVTGDIEIAGGQTLSINGVLVSDGDIIIGKNYPNCCWGTRCGLTSVALIHASGSPAGILAKGNINFEQCLDDFQGTGLIYAGDKMSLNSLKYPFRITGGMIARKLDLTNLWNTVDIIADKSLTSLVLGGNAISQATIVDYWEEEY